METIVNGFWQKAKVLVKGIIIAVIALLLLIPAFFVQELIQEREARQKEAVLEVSSKWAGKQNITGPILVIPYYENLPDTSGTTSKKLAYFLPQKLNFDANVKPEKKHRGIYEVMLYSSDIWMTGSFAPIPLQSLNLSAGNMLLNEAYITVGISDMKGLRDEIKLEAGDSIIPMNSYSVNDGIYQEALMTPIHITQEHLDKGFSFSTAIGLNGSEQLLFTPSAKETTVKMNSTWDEPSFTGAQLPNWEKKDSGFVANWKMHANSTKFPQSWKDKGYNMTQAASGADLFIPVNDYQKTMRSVKYAILCIILTFTSFFLMESTNKKSVHPFHYALIGFALLMFYTLLLSFSEYIGFNASYVIAGLATIGLITWFVKDLLGSFKLSAILSSVLFLLYTYVFTILQLQDYALILGSVGLFLALAVVMHFSKKIQW